MAYEVYGRVDGQPGCVIVLTGAGLPNEMKRGEWRSMNFIAEAPSSVRREIQAKGWSERPLWRSSSLEADMATEG